MSAIAYGIRFSSTRLTWKASPSCRPVDIKYAEQLGYRIKLLGIARRQAAGIELRTHPTLVPQRRLIANVEGAMNAVMVQGDAVGTTMYYGKGAGSGAHRFGGGGRPGRHRSPDRRASGNRVPPWLSSLIRCRPADLADRRGGDLVLLRLRVADQTGVLAKITGILAEQGISIDAVIQREADEVSGEGGNQTDLILLTHDPGGAMNKAIAAMQALPTVLQPPSCACVRKKPGPDRP